jgi:hypothetical protein
MEATIVIEGNEFVVYGEVQDELGYSPDAELFRGTTLFGAEQWALTNGYLIEDIRS